MRRRIRELLSDPVKRQRLLDGAVRAILAVGRDGIHPVPDPEGSTPPTAGGAANAVPYRLGDPSAPAPTVPAVRPPLRWYHRLLWFLVGTDGCSDWRWFRRIVGGRWICHLGNCGHSYRNEIHTGWCLDRTETRCIFAVRGDPEEVYPYPPLRWQYEHRAHPYDQRGPAVGDLADPHARP